VTNTPSSSSAKAVRTGRFSFKEPTLLRPRVRLFPDALVLEGWHWRGRFRRRFPLRNILQVDVTSTGRLLIWTRSGETLRLRLTEALAWKQAIESYQTSRPDTARMDAEMTPPDTPTPSN